MAILPLNTSGEPNDLEDDTRLYRSELWGVHPRQLRENATGLFQRSTAGANVWPASRRAGVRMVSGSRESLLLSNGDFAEMRSFGRGLKNGTNEPADDDVSVGGVCR